ncbi:MAG: carboxylating nicotinate-nucleotide diphosphorylase [Acidimicrobiia bacterium]|nr:carboxylating nicotinate-nucleotide diphosphorylase [Acidimicrobiia bacterium]
MALIRIQYLPILEAALREDLGVGGDLTTDAIFSADETLEAAFVARSAGVVACLPAALDVFGLLDRRVEVEMALVDGSDLSVGQTIATVHGPARAILTGERTALNLLGRMSGIATTTRRVVAAVAGTGVAVADTRKTTPGLRLFEKHAVRMGGGVNHRFRLDDAVMIKDNHVAAAGNITEAVRRVRSRVGHTVKIEVEVDTLEQVAELMAVPVDIVLLDNMDVETLRRAVEMIDGRMVTEASGGITLETAREIAETGVDVLSLGWLTHSAPNLDIGLDV